MTLKFLQRNKFCCVRDDRMSGGISTAMEVPSSTVGDGKISNDKVSMERSLSECVYEVQGCTKVSQNYHLFLC